MGFSAAACVFHDVNKHSDGLGLKFSISTGKVIEYRQIRVKKQYAYKQMKMFEPHIKPACKSKVVLSPAKTMN